jgi:hypothetical protein
MRMCSKAGTLTKPVAHTDNLAPLRPLLTLRSSALRMMLRDTPVEAGGLGEVRVCELDGNSEAHDQHYR